MTDKIVLAEEMTPDELRSQYDVIAPGYDRKLWFDQAIFGVARFRRQLMSQARGKILDVACGTGLNFPFFPAGSNTTGIDFSPGMLEVAFRLGLNVELVIMDAQKLEFPDQIFSTVVTSLSTCTFPDPIQALKEMRRVCRSDGQILLLEHGHSSLPWIAAFQDRHVHRHYKENAGCRWNQDPLALIQATGLKILKSERAILGIYASIQAAP